MGRCWNEVTLTRRLLLISILVSSASATPYSKWDAGRLREPEDDARVGRLAYTLEGEQSDQQIKEDKALSVLSSFLHGNPLMSSVMNVIGRLSHDDRSHIHGVKNHASRRYSTTQLRRSYDDDLRSTGSARAFEASLSHDVPTKAVHHTSKQQKSVMDEAWAETLFGPRGVLTAIFHMIDDRQKGKEPDEAPNTAHSPTNTQHDGPYLIDLETFKNAKPIDFAKIFQAFLSNSQGDFEDPIAELPGFLGICNRLSCGDIYKAIDEFRKSEFFSNFQTAMQLIQDPKGWDIIGDLLSNPELISQFTGGGAEGLGKLLGSVTSAGGKAKPDKPSPGGKRPTTDIGPGDGDLGTDFSGLVNEKKPPKERKPTSEELPEIAENVDGTDYYSAVESGVDELEQTSGGVETVEKPDEIVPVETVEKPEVEPPSPVEVKVEEVDKGGMPEISESIDETPETVDGTYSVVVDKSPDSGGRTSKTGLPPAPRASPIPPSYTRVTPSPFARLSTYEQRTTMPHRPFGPFSRQVSRVTTRRPYPVYTYGTRSTPSHTAITRPYGIRTTTLYPAGPYPERTTPYGITRTYAIRTTTSYPARPYTEKTTPYGITRPYGTRTAETSYPPRPYTERTTPPYPYARWSSTPHPYGTRTYATRTSATSTLATTTTTVTPGTTTRRSWRSSTRVTPSATRATTKNFRKDSDYYSMYYDDEV